MTELMPLARSLGALCLLIGLLATALWTVRRYGISLPGMVVTRPEKRLALVERLAIDAKRSLLLVRRDTTEHLLLSGPEGVQIIERRILSGLMPVAASGRTTPDAPLESPPAPDDLAKLRVDAHRGERARRMAQLDAAL